MEVEIDFETALYIEREVRKEADRAREEASRARREVLAAVGLLVSLLAVAAALGIREWIGGMVTSQLEEQGFLEIQEQARDGRDLIFANLDQARDQIQTNVSTMNEHLEAAAQIRAEWEGQPAIEVGNYMLRVPFRSGTWKFDTRVHTEDFAAAAISGFYMSGNDNRPCFYSENLRGQTVGTGMNWVIWVQKEEGCNRAFAVVVYFPKGWVGNVDDVKVLTPMK